ncbi:hypothetical protein B0H14DRAFT_2675699, partial [Mycena olivaceomarginata]
LRQSKGISQWLPNEILTHIIQDTLQGDQLALSRVSKLFHALVVPVLYCVVKVETVASRHVFCHTLLSKPILGGLVRSMTLRCSPDFREVPDKAHIALILDSLKLLLRLRHLSLNLTLYNPVHGRAFLELSFPCLVSCHMGLGSYTNDHPTLHFLRRHPGLISFSSPLGIQLEIKPPLSMPGLRALGAPVSFVRGIVTRELREAKLAWGFKSRNLDIENHIIALTSRIPDGAPFIMTINECDYRLTEILDSLSRNIPYTRTLCLRWQHLADLRENIATAVKSLRRFYGLEFISIENMPDNNWLTKPEAFALAHSYNDACPTLEACSIGGHTWRKVNSIWQEFPSSDFPALAGITLP